MNKIALLDMNAIGYSAAMSAKYGAEPNRYPDLYTEVRYLMAKTLYSLRVDIGWDFCLALYDSKPYWREEYFSEWYNQNAEYSPSFDLLRYDNKIYAFEDGVKSKKPLNVKDIPDVDDWTFVPLEKREFLPKYKGNRTGTWDLEIPKAECSKLNQQAVELIHLLNGVGLRVSKFEADDLAAAYATHKEGAHIVLVTKDKDWCQLLRPNVDMLDLQNGDYYNGSDPAIQQWGKDILRNKLYGGDASDNISGVPKGKKGCWSSKGVAKALAEGTAIEVPTAYLKRQNTMIRLPAPGRDSETLFKLMNTEIKAKFASRDMSASWDDWALPEKIRKPLDDKLKVKNFLSNLSRGKNTPNEMATVEVELKV